MRLRGKVKYWLHTKCPGFVGAFRYFGTLLHFPKESFLFKLVCDAGIFEQQTLQIIASQIKPGTCYFDVGANIGLMAVPILKMVENCSVVSFEPSPNVVPFLEKTQAGSADAARWKIIPKAVGDSPRYADFCVHGPGLSAFDGLENTGRHTSQKVVRVEVTTIDAEWEALQCPHVSVIKCDVEGGELGVLRGARKCIQKNRPVILVEWNEENFKSYNHKAADLLEVATKLDYHVISSLAGTMIHHACEIEISNATGMEVFVLFPR